MAGDGKRRTRQSHSAAGANGASTNDGSNETPKSSAKSSKSVAKSPSAAASHQAPRDTSLGSLASWDIDHLPYKQPSLRNPLHLPHHLWRLYEHTFAISLLETWEKLLLHIILISVAYFLYFAVRHYLPNHIRLIAGRVIYYIKGTSDGSL